MTLLERHSCKSTIWLMMETQHAYETHSSINAVNGLKDISEPTIQEMCENLELFPPIIRLVTMVVSAGWYLGHVFVTVHNVLQKDPNLKARLANEDQFKENVKKKGEQQFTNLLGNIAKKESW
jgi:hypothetical protein